MFRGNITKVATMIDVFIIVLIVCACLVLFVSDDFAAVICLSVFSLICALSFFLLNAPDVSIAEAAVGAGLSTIVFGWAVGKTRSDSGKGELN